jgi:hypothetical protein
MPLERLQTPSMTRHCSLLLTLQTTKTQHPDLTRLLLRKLYALNARMNSSHLRQAQASALDSAAPNRVGVPTLRFPVLEVPALSSITTLQDRSLIDPLPVPTRMELAQHGRSSGLISHMTTLSLAWAGRIHSVVPGSRSINWCSPFLEAREDDPSISIVGIVYIRLA